MLVSAEVAAHLRRIGGLAYDQLQQFNIGEMAKTVPIMKLLNDRYEIDEMRYIGKGSFGFVFDAETKLLNKTMMISIKFQFSEPSNIVAEGRIQRMLTDLWSRGAVDTAVMSPIVQVYDFTEFPVSVDLDQLNGILKPAVKKSFNNQKDAERVIQAIDAAYKERGVVTQEKSAKGKSIEVGLLMAEYIDGGHLWGRLYTNPLEWQSFFIQTFFTLYSMQEMYGFVHGDAHLGNIMVRRLDNPVWLYYAIASGHTFYIRATRVVALNDFGFSSLDSPPAAAWRFGLRSDIRTIMPTGYHYQRVGQEAEFRPWQDQMCMAASTLEVLHAYINNFSSKLPAAEAYERQVAQWDKIRATGLFDLLYDMLDIHFADGDWDRRHPYWQEERGHALHTVLQLLKSISIPLDSIWPAYFTLIRKTIYDAILYIPLPIIISSHEALFRDVMTRQPPNPDDETQIASMTLTLGNDTTALFEWPDPKKERYMLSDREFQRQKAVQSAAAAAAAALEKEDEKEVKGAPRAVKT